jgi:DNA-binding transcriptional MocR family regulator
MNSFDYQDAILASDLSANAKLTALAISYHYNWKQAIQSFPSIASLVSRTSLSKATIHRAKAELISRGFLVSTRRYNNSNLYLPVIPTPSQSETLVVSHRRTNNEYNYEYNNEIKEEDSNESLATNNNFSLENEKIWEMFR